jgi:hypothetical protein
VNDTGSWEPLVCVAIPFFHGYSKNNIINDFYFLQSCYHTKNWAFLGETFVELCMQGELDNSYYIDPYTKVFLTNIKNSVVLVEAFNMFMISVSKQYLEGINSFCVLLCMWSHILLLKTATILTLLHHPLSLIFLYLYLLCQINF